MTNMCYYTEAETKFEVDLDDNPAKDEGVRCPSLTITHGSDQCRHFLSLEQLSKLRDQLITALPMVNMDLGKQLFEQACKMNEALAQHVKGANDNAI